MKQVGTDVLTMLEEKAKSVEWKAGNRKNHFIIFSISGFTGELTRLAEARKDVLLCH